MGTEVIGKKKFIGCAILSAKYRHEGSKRNNFIFIISLWYTKQEVEINLIINLYFPFVFHSLHLSSRIVLSWSGVL